MNKKTLFKFIEITKKEIDELLLEKFNLEELINKLEVELLSMKKKFEQELKIAQDVFCYGFRLAEFVKHELHKQSQKKVEIDSQITKLSSLIEVILEKNVDKKTYEHLLEQIVNQEKFLHEKAEIEILNNFSLHKYVATS